MLTLYALVLTGCTQSSDQSSNTNSSIHINKPEKLTMQLYVAAILEKDDSYFLIQRKNTHGAEGYCNFLGGPVEPSETLLQAAIREIHEELVLRFH